MGKGTLYGSGAMNESTLDPAIVQELKSVMGGDFRTLVDSFVRDSRQRLETLEEAITNGAAEEVRQTAHSFKGSSGNLGALALSNLCLELEQIGRSGELAGAREKLEEIRAAFDHAREQLEQETG